MGSLFNNFKYRVLDDTPLDKVNKLIENYLESSDEKLQKFGMKYILDLARLDIKEKSLNNYSAEQNDAFLTLKDLEKAVDNMRDKIPKFPVGEIEDNDLVTEVTGEELVEESILTEKLGVGECYDDLDEEYDEVDEIIY